MHDISYANLKIHSCGHICHCVHLELYEKHGVSDSSDSTF